MGFHKALVLVQIIAGGGVAFGHICPEMAEYFPFFAAQIRRRSQPRIRSLRAGDSLRTREIRPTVKRLLRRMKVSLSIW